MAGRTVPLTAGTKDWPRLVSGAVRRLGERLDAVELPDLIKLIPRAEPTSPEEGWAYMDSTTHKLRVYDGTTWNDCW